MQAVAAKGDPKTEFIDKPKSDLSQQYVFCRLEGE